MYVPNNTGWLKRQTNIAFDRHSAKQQDRAVSADTEEIYTQLLCLTY